MINVNCGPNILIGLLVVLAFLCLYFVRTVKIELARDIDVFYTSLGLIYGSILVIHGWRLDPILLFSQFVILITYIIKLYSKFYIKFKVKKEKINTLKIYYIIRR